MSSTRKAQPEDNSPLVDAKSDGEGIASRMPARGVQPATSFNRLSEAITSEA